MISSDNFWIKEHKTLLMKSILLAAASPRIRQIVGWLSVFGSAFFFYLATLIIRWAQAYTVIPSSFYVFSRFFLGFIVVIVSMRFARQHLKPRKYHFLLGRMAANTIAVFCFYEAVSRSSVAEANILNMTYPMFVAVFSWIFLKSQRDALSFAIVGMAFVGVYLVLSPGAVSGPWHNIWGLCSGIFAAAAIIYLNVSRRYHDSQTILFFLFGLGAVMIFIFFHNDFFWPDEKELFFLFTCSVAGVLGQYLMTYGFLFVTAVEGSVISSSRILLAAVLGPVLVADPPLGILGWCGAFLIFGANVILALRKRS